MFVMFFSIAKGPLLNIILILHPESFILCKKAVHNSLNLELNTAFDF